MANDTDGHHITDFPTKSSCKLNDGVTWSVDLVEVNTNFFNPVPRIYQMILSS